MGLVTSQARLLMLTARKTDIEFLTQSITQQIMTMSGAIMNLSTAMATTQNNMMSGGQNSQTQGANAVQQAQIERLQQWNKTLELLLKQYETQHQAIQTELESVKKCVDKGIECDFKYFG
ncbi:MAG: hypothetical protein WCK67_13265 [bacterium]